MTIGQRLLQLRQSLALSQEEFGERLGVSRQTVSKWELDQSLPELAKVVLISRTFSVTTDSILIDGITSFEHSSDDFVCGIYRSELCEIAETEKFSLVFSCNPDKSVLSAKFFAGFRDKKHLRAVCERDEAAKKTKYAYLTAENGSYSNDPALAAALGEKYDTGAKTKMVRSESFAVKRAGALLPTVGEAGILKALQAWRMCGKLTSNAERFSFSLCSDRTEYIFSIDVQDENIYCGASYNWVFDLGLFVAGQYFRIRNYKDNSAPFCGFGCNFSYSPKTTSVPTDKCGLKTPCAAENSMTFTVKRYDDEQIVLKGCGDDEYTYRRDEERAEIYVKR